MNPNYIQGQYAANIVFGFTKEAFAFASKPSFLQRAGKTLKRWAPTWSGTKKMMIGEPGKFMNELANRKMLAKGSLIRKGFHAPGLLNKTLFYGLPALDAVNIVRSDSPNKAEDLASLAGGSMAGLAAFRPLGMVGALAASAGGSALGRGLVSGGRKLLGNVAQPLPQQQSTIPYRQFYPYASGINYLAGGS